MPEMPPAEESLTGVVTPFRPRAAIHGGANLQAFVESQRELNPIAVPDWDAPRWPYPKTSRASAASEGGLVFSLRSANKVDPGVFPEPFLSFVKAVVCAYNTRGPRLYAVGQSQTLIAASRLLFDVMYERSTNPTDLRHGDFEAAANRAAALMGDGAANVGSKLAIIADEMDRRKLTAVPIRWRSSIKRDHKHDRVGAKATARRHEKLPSTAALDALGAISARTDLDDRDLLVQRAIDLLVCGGFRINEVLTLPRESLVEEPVVDENGIQMLDLHGRPAVRVGIRYWPEKGGHLVSQIKWLPSAMIDLARRAIEDATRITAPFVTTARYQQSHPDTTLLGAPWDSMADECMLGTSDIARAVGLTTKNPLGAGRQFAIENDLDIEYHQNDGTRTVLKASLGSLRRRLHQRSIKGNVLNGYVGTLDIADALFVVPRFFVKRTLACGMNGTVQLLSDASVQVYLVSQANGSQPSIFERFGHVDEDGSPLRIHSHQFRHMLTTLAAEGSVSEVEIARWMGRNKIVQNSAYQHVTPLVRAEALRQRLRANEALGPVAEHAATVKDPVRREEFIMSTTATAHITDSGFCVHPWDALPCEKHGGCHSCSEHRILKGDPASRANAQTSLMQTNAILEAAASEAGDGTYGVDNWLDAHERTAADLRRLIAVHDDPNIADGTMVQLADASPRHGGANDA